MRTSEILREIRRLPIGKRIFVIEKAIRDMRKNEDKNQMEKAAEALSSDYREVQDLTIFTNLDFEEFYETR